MKRTLTVLAIAAAMIAFVACGKKSPDNVEVKSPEATVVLPTGIYGDKQEIGIFKVATTTDEDKAALASLKEERKRLSDAELNILNGIDEVSLYQGKTASLTDRAVTARFQAIQTAMAKLDPEIQKMEKELIDFKITFIRLSISQENDGNYKVSDLVIRTDKDQPDYARDRDGNIIYLKGKPVVFMKDSKLVHKNIPAGSFVFDGAELVDGGKVNYNILDGSLQFAMLHKGVKYTFKGRVESKEEGHARISGNMEVTCDSCDHVLQTEQWSVALPAVEESLPLNEVKTEKEVEVSVTSSEKAKSSEKKAVLY